MLVQIPCLLHLAIRLLHLPLLSSFLRASAALFPNMCMMYFFHFKRDWHRAVLFAPVGPIIQLFSDPLFQVLDLHSIHACAVDVPFLESF